VKPAVLLETHHNSLYAKTGVGGDVREVHYDFGFESASGRVGYRETARRNGLNQYYTRCYMLN
jgi:hypothetical protein